MCYPKVLFLSVLALSLVRLAANDIEPGKEFYDATFTPNPIVLDGKLDEWVGVPVLADPKYAVPKGSGTNGTYVLFEEYQGGTWTGPDDHTSAVQVVWDAENLYIGIVVTDDYHENSANSPWNGDSAQLMIANGTRTAEVGLFNYALGGVEDALGEVIVQHERGPTGTDAVVTRDSATKKTTYEIKFPATALGLQAPLKAGTKVGLGMAINDGDELTPGQKGWGGLGAHSIVFGKTPSETAQLTLSTNIPGKDRVFFSAVNPAIDAFSFRATDKGASVLDPASVKLIIDGQPVTLSASPKTGDATDFSYKPASPFPPGSDHTYTIEVKDTQGNTITDSGEFKTARYALLMPADKVAADTSKRGFIFNVHQNSAFTANNNVRPLNQLSGALGENFADPNAQGNALAPGTAGASNRLPIRFEIDSVINLSQMGGDFTGNVQPDEQMPGIPGVTGEMDGIAAEILTYLDLPAGKHTLIVNSDDGFRTTAGKVEDVFLAQTAGESTAAGETSYAVIVQEAGIYAFRTVWAEGTGGANIEWLSLKPDNTKVLLNDTANGGIRAYRAVTGPVAASVSEATPAPGATGVAFDAPVRVVLKDGQTAVDTASVKLAVDGQPVNVTPTKTGNLTTLEYKPASFWAPGSTHTAALSFTAGTVSRTNTWQFTVVNYAQLSKAHQAVSVDTSKRGFLWSVFQNETYTHNSLAETELALAGQLKGGGTEVLENLADPAAVGPALAPGVKAGALWRFEIPTVINLSQMAGDSNGNFGSDEQMPGIPGLNGMDDGIDAEIITFAELPAGVVTMGVNSDDGFRTQAGYINVPADGLLLGEFDAGRGASDTIFRFVVQEAGVYPIRTIWQEGGGGANIEIFSVKADGTKVLLNDMANGGLRTYRSGVAPSKPASFRLASRMNGGKYEITWTEAGCVLQQSTDLKTWTDLSSATSPYQPASAATAATFYRLKK